MFTLELTTTGVIGDSDKQFWCGDGGQSLTGICLGENHKLETLSCWGREMKNGANSIFNLKVRQVIVCLYS